MSLLNMTLSDQTKEVYSDQPSYNSFDLQPLLWRIIHFIKLQGIYTYDAEAPSIQVDTFCVHGGPDGYITGIRGKVQCLPEEDTEKQETDLERKEMIREKCYLRFPTLPFIPKEPYDVIETDYDNFALVSGAKDKSFIQVNLASNWH